MFLLVIFSFLVRLSPANSSRQWPAHTSQFERLLRIVFFVSPRLLGARRPTANFELRSSKNRAVSLLPRLLARLRNRSELCINLRPLILARE